MSRDCDVLHRYRSSCHAKRGAPECALADAQRAAALNPRGSQCHWRVARVLEQQVEHTAAGGAYLAAMRRGMPAATGEVGEVRFANLLDSVRRTRSYANMVRPLSRECVHQHGLGASKSLGGLGMVRRPSRVGGGGGGGGGARIWGRVGVGSRGRGRGQGRGRRRGSPEPAPAPHQVQRRTCPSIWDPRRKPMQRRDATHRTAAAHDA